MSPLNVTLTPAMRSEMLVVIDALFWIFVPLSFACVASYVARQARLGTLVNNPNAPLPFYISNIMGWCYAVGVLASLYFHFDIVILLIIAGTLGLAVESGRTVAQQFGLTRLRPGLLLKWSVICFGAVMLGEIPLMNFSIWALNLTHLPHPEQETVEAFRQYTDFTTIFLFIVQAAIISPLLEELFFRAFLQTFLKRYTSTWMALVLAAGFFAFAHVNLEAALPLWLLGVALALAYEHTGSILLPIGIHACWNFYTALSLLVAKGNS